MNNDYYNIKGIGDLRAARENLQQEIDKTKYRFGCHKDALVDSIMPAKILTSALGGVVSVVSDVALLHKGCNWLLAFVENILSDKRTPASDVDAGEELSSMDGAQKNIDCDK